MRRSEDDIRVKLELSDPDDGPGWWELLEPFVLLVDDDPDVVLCDGRSDAQVPVVCLSDDVLDDVAGQVAAHSPVEVVVAALWAVHRGLRVRPRAGALDADGERPSLTQREQQVLELLALGLSNREIGAELDISPHTAKFHVQGLLEKLDATTRTEAAVRAARLLLI